MKWVGKKYEMEVKEGEVREEEKEGDSLGESLFVVNEFGCEYLEEIVYNEMEGEGMGMR